MLEHPAGPDAVAAFDNLRNLAREAGRNSDDIGLEVWDVRGWRAGRMARRGPVLERGRRHPHHLQQHPRAAIITRAFPANHCRRTLTDCSASSMPFATNSDSQTIIHTGRPDRCRKNRSSHPASDRRAATSARPRWSRPRAALVFISGMLAKGADGTLTGIGDVAEQTRQVCENLKAAVEEAGGTMADICPRRRLRAQHGAPSMPFTKCAASTSPIRHRHQPWSRSPR